MAPQMIHRIQMRAPLGQPQELDVAQTCQRLRGMCRVTALFIQHHAYLPTSIMLVNHVQERLETLLAMVLLGQEQARSGPCVDRAKGHALGVHAADRHLRGLSTQRPRSPQRWKQQQIGFVLEEDHPSPTQLFKPPADISFFSPRQGLAVERSASASRRSPSNAACGGWCLRRAKTRPTKPTAAAIKERSNSPLDSPIAWAVRARAFPGVHPNPESMPWGDRSERHPAMPRGQRIECTPQSNCRSIVESPPMRKRPEQWASGDRFPRAPASGGTEPRLGHAATVVEADNAASE